MDQAQQPPDVTLPVKGIDFGEALAALKRGKRMQRAGWNGKGMWIAIHQPSEREHMSLPFIYMKTADDFYVPWLASQTDILANDWDYA